MLVLILTLSSSSLRVVGSSFAPYPIGCEENQLLPLGLGQIIDFQAQYLYYY